MREVDKQTLVSDLIVFLTSEPACQQALGCLDKKAEIAIRIAHSVEVKVVYDGTRVDAIEAPPLAPDFVFDATPEAIAILVSEKGLSPTQLGLKFIKEIMNRESRVSMPSSIFQITRKGYFKILTLGGTELLAELRKHNLASLPKITAALKRLRGSK